MAQTVVDQLWIEKYRPRIIDETLVMDESIKKKFKAYAKAKDMPHILLVGPPGTGKTTIAKALMRQILGSELDQLVLNGSRDNGIDIIRDRISPFMRLAPDSSPIKICFIDEFDGLSQNAFNSLRSTMEQPEYNTNYNTRFIFTANYIEKIPEPIVSRCTVFDFSALPKETIMDRCKVILDEEEIRYTEDDIKTIIDLSYPDIRSVINNLQRSSENGVLIPEISNTSNVRKITDLVNQILDTDEYIEGYNIYNECRAEIEDTNIDLTYLMNQILSLHEDNIILYGFMISNVSQIFNNTTVNGRAAVLGMLSCLLNHKMYMDYNLRRSNQLYDNTSYETTGISWG